VNDKHNSYIAGNIDSDKQDRKVITIMFFFNILHILADLLFCLNPLKTKRKIMYLKTQFVPRCKHFLSRL